MADTAGEDGATMTGLFPAVSGKDVRLERSGAGLVAAARDVTVRQGGAQFVAAGRDLRIEQGGGSVLAAGNRLELHQGGGGLLAAQRAQVSRSLVGVVLAQHVDLEDSRVLLAPGPTAVVCALAGIAVGVVLARRRRRRADDRLQHRERN